MFLGIDTSAYTTSVSLIDNDGSVFGDYRQVLHVKEGQRGLQQSQAVFQHIKNLPVLISQALKNISPADIQAIGVSSQPRPLTESYMPVFVPGVSSAEILAVSLNVPLYKTSHQEGHLMAGFYPDQPFDEPSFLAVHLSGGTSELLKVTTNKEPFGFEEEIIGGTTDLHAGQFVDRVGVALGLAFPCGQGLEKLAESAATSSIKLSASADETNFSFSGPESQAQRAIKAGANSAEVARAVQECIATTMIKVITKGVELTGINRVLIVGGVASNNYLRIELRKKLQFRNIQTVFAKRAYSSDNAVGSGLIAKQSFG